MLAFLKGANHMQMWQSSFPNVHLLPQLKSKKKQIHLHLVILDYRIVSPILKGYFIIFIRRAKPFMKHL